MYTTHIKENNLIQKILVPVDFSSNSLHAAQYAGKIATELGAKLELIHVLPPNYSGNYPEVLPAGLLIEEERYKAVVSEGERFKQQLADDWKLSSDEFPLIIEFGFPEIKIVDYSSQHNFDLIIMGNAGQNNLDKIIFGSVARSVVQHSSKPVLLIPESISFSPYLQMVYASDQESASDTNVKYAIDLGHLFQSELHFLHISDHAVFDSILKEKIFTKLIERNKNVEDVTFEVIFNEDVIEGLNNYVKNNHIDLVILVNRKRTFLERLFESGLTKQLAKEAKLPLLILHH
ncbi:MAG: universal stress protein [Bacteroidota bacterium]|nr:universal stress protein [Bacteroidota bacterium]